MAGYGIAPIVGVPGTGTAVRVNFLTPFWSGNLGWLNVPNTIYIHGAIARDPGNTGYEDVLRPGVLIGLASSGTYSGYYGTSVIGSLTGAVSSGGTSITLSAGEATELVRRVGSTGTILIVGPPSAAGTVATLTQTYSAVNTTTGVVTTNSLGANLIAGSMVSANDGTAVPKFFIAEPQSGMKVTDLSGNSVASPLSRIPAAGEVDYTKLIPAPTDTSLRTYICQALSSLVGGKFIFRHAYTS